MSLASRITEIRKSKGVSIDDLVEKSGVPKGTLSKISAGITANPSLDTVQAIAKALGCRLDDFDDAPRVNGKTDSPTPAAQRVARLYDKADDRAREIVDFTLKPFDTDTTPPHSDTEFAAELAPVIEFPKTALPHYLQATTAGLGNYLDDEYYEMQEFTNVPKRANIAVTISGDSMTPKYNPDDIVFVETDSVLDDGEVGIFCHNGQSYIKQLRLNPPRLVSINKEYPDIFLGEDDVCRTIGRVVGKASK